MQVLAVAQAFKGSLDVGVVAESLATGIRRAGATPTVLLGSDGGDGMLDALASRLIRRTRHETVDPLSRRIDAEVGWLDPRTAVVESRLACGLSLLEAAERDPERTTSRGVGILISAAQAAGAETVYVGLGGSATVDGGVGMARAWDWLPRGADGAVLAEGGGSLLALRHLDPGQTPGARIIGLADVTSPLLGVDGAARFAAQKGATPDAVARLAGGLEQLVAVTSGWSGVEAARRPGAGAAGGLGFGLVVFAGGRIEPGAPWVLDGAGWTDVIGDADLVMIGEGAFDGTSRAGKLTGEVLRRARAAARPVALLAPVVHDPPPGITVETGGASWWNADELARRAESAVRRALRLPRP